MAYEIQGFILSLPASADLSALQYTAIGVAADGEAETATAAGVMVGILQNKPDAVGKAASVMVDKVSKFIAGAGGVTAGDELQVGAGGTLVTASTGVVVAIALTTTGATGIGSCLLKP